MKRLILFCGILLSFPLAAQFQNTTGQPTGAPTAEVMHEKTPGYVITASGDSINGLIQFYEFGERTIYVHTNHLDKTAERQVTTFKEPSEIKSMFLHGRGYFVPVDLFKTGKLNLAHIKQENAAYTEYELFQSGEGVLGHKISGGMVQGHYDTFLYNKRKGELFQDKTVKNLKSTIDQYIDYCPEINEKVKSEEKGYKQNLVNPAYPLLKGLLFEAHEKCGK